jgi:LCP family protein required for cell wall assembly
MEFYTPPQNNKTNKKKIFFAVAGIVLFGYVALRLALAYNEIVVTSDNNDQFWQKVSHILTLAEPKEEPTPSPEPNRLDILVLGMRGEDDPESTEGGLLTDTILLFSFDKTTGKSSLVSVPRDLYVKIDGAKNAKINEVYEYGLLKKKQGLDFTKRLFANLTSVHIDNMVVFDFNAFKKIVDELGGIDITLDKPFEEKSQWGTAFNLPAGPNHLNGEQALYFARSRYSTSDFDRSRRQQQIIGAIKDKIMQLNLLSDPVKAFNILNIIRSDMETDINIWDMKSLLDLAQQLNKTKPKQFVISTDNLLYETVRDSMYILLPKGDNYVEFKKLFQDVIL